jgi:GTP-binding protein
MFRVAIVGRPNVGKSTLFNRMCGKRGAIVGDEPGITRDRIYGTARWQSRMFELLDTGGMMPNVRDVIPVKILEQVEQAIAESDLLLLVVDGRAGLTPLDERLMPMLRRTGKPIWAVVNKIDVPQLEPEAAAFYALGVDEVFPLSAEHNRGVSDLLHAIGCLVAEPEDAAGGDTPEEILVAVVGRPNVGKSSLVNRLLGTERAIVSEIPGTTRDSIDTLLDRDGVRYRIIDTAGIRRKGRTEERTEKVSVVVARKSLARASVALLLIDAVEGVTKLDAAIGGYAEDSGCSVILVVNKWDRIARNGQTLEEYTASIRRRMKYLSYAPIITVSALTGQRVPRLFELIQKAHEGRRTRVSTGVLNNVFAAGLERDWRKDHPNSRLDVRYITQARGEPPTFVVFTGGHNPLHFSTERLLINQLREKFGFYGTPIRIRQRVRKREGSRSGH